MHLKIITVLRKLLNIMFIMESNLTKCVILISLRVLLYLFVKENKLSVFY